MGLLRARSEGEELVAWRGGSPLAGVDLGPYHTHDLLLDLGLLGVDVGVAHLTVLVPAEVRQSHRLLIRGLTLTLTSNSNNQP